MKLSAFLFVIGLFDLGFTMVYGKEPHANLEVSPRAEVIMGNNAQERSKQCRIFNDKWNQSNYEYRIPSKSFCSDYCNATRSSDPWWFDCDEKIMPDIEFHFSHPFLNSYPYSCNVTTRNGILSNVNNQCITAVSDFLNNSNGKSNKLIYITHGFGWKIDYFFHGDWLKSLKDSLFRRYAHKGATVVGIVRWIEGAVMVPRKSKNLELSSKKLYKNILCCHPKKILANNFILPLNYGTSATNTWPIGNIVAYVNANIFREPAPKRFKTICIGHSLGSHVCGFFGKMSKKLKRTLTVDKIIGLDPAGPIFDYDDQAKSLRLDKTDALDVEVYHTNSDMYGYRNPIGDRDFYFSGGNTQRGLGYSILPGYFGLSHNMVPKFFVELNKNTFDCYAEWKCNITDGSQLKDIRKPDKRKQLAALKRFCQKTPNVTWIGDLDDVNTRHDGVYWVDVHKNSKSCNFNANKKSTEGIVDRSTVNVPDESLSKLEVSQEAQMAVDLTKGYRTKRCELFDKLWKEKTYEYNVPKKSFCSDTCGPFGFLIIPEYMKPYWFQCKEEIMPEIHFFFSNNETCHVTSKNGIKDPNNAACIKEVSGFLNQSSTNDVSTNKLVYITHRFGEGLEKRYLNRNWMIELKNSTLQRYAWKNGNTMVVGIVSWETGANMKPQQQDIVGQNLPQMGEKYKSLICCHPRSLPWGKPLIFPLNYGVASANTWAVGNILAYVNRKISLAFTTKSYTTSCIGHSLGAQVCGFFGKMSQNLVPNITVDKIIGLDPAGPIFDLKEQDESLRLNKDDALNVEIFHTNSLLYGYRNPIGDVDFYINGGNYQYGKPGRIERYKDAVTVRSHSMPVDLLISINIIYFPCFAKWKCSITDGYELVDITTEDRPALESKSCFKTSSNVTLGDLDAVNTNLTGVYWIDVASNSTTCPYDRGSFKCADEGEECKCTGSVKYGSGSKWTKERYTDKDTVSCTNDVFGDPRPFSRKECRCTPAIADNITASEFLPTPNMERLYDFQYENIIGINGLTTMKNIAFQPSDPNMDINVMLTAEVKIQSYPDHTMRIKINKPTFHLLEEENVLKNGHEMIETRTKTFGPRVHVKPQFKKYLTDPMVVLMKGMSFRSLIVSKMEPANITNIKTYLVQELRLNGLSPSLRLLNTSGILEPLKIPNQPTKIKL